MQLPQLQLRSQMAKINISQTKGTQQLSQPKADLTIKQPHASLSIRTRPSKLTIDQTQAFADANLMSILRRNDRAAAEALSKSKAGTTRRAREGTDLMKVENQGQPIISHAKNNSERPKKQLGIEFIPSQFSVKINYQPADVNINAETNAPVVQARKNNPVHNYQPSDVNISLAQRQQLDIDFINVRA